MPANNELILGVGLAHDLEMAFRRAGWTNREIKSLSSGPMLGIVRELLAGRITYQRKPAFTMSIEDCGLTNAKMLADIMVEGIFVGEESAKFLLKPPDSIPPRGMKYHFVGLTVDECAAGNVAGLDDILSVAESYGYRKPSIRALLHLRKTLQRKKSISLLSFFPTKGKVFATIDMGRYKEHPVNGGKIVDFLSASESLPLVGWSSGYIFLFLDTKEN